MLPHSTCCHAFAHTTTFSFVGCTYCRLDHKPKRQQHKQQLLECINFDRMNNYELAQVGCGVLNARLPLQFSVLLVDWPGQV
jgi:hypothetical protein